MNEQLTFTAVVNHGEVCPYARHAHKYRNIPMPSFDAEKVYAENLIAITQAAKCYQSLSQWGN
jgi:hypothetical protein